MSTKIANLDIFTQKNPNVRIFIFIRTFNKSEELKKISNIIAWNIWQMDGLTGTVPLGKPKAMIEQSSLDLFGDPEEEFEPCRIFDWKANKSFAYNSIKGER